MLNYYLGNKEALYIIDRHEEKDTDSEDRRLLYDKRILSLLQEDDSVIFGEKINFLLLNYYRTLGLAEIKDENVFYEPNYLNHPSLTKAVLNDDSLINKLRTRKFNLLVPYIESADTKKIADVIGCRTLREADITDWVNNKSNYRQILKELDLLVIPGCTVSSLDNARNCFLKLKKRGFRKVLLKKERSVAGFGIWAVESPEDLNKCLEKNFSDSKSFLVEAFIDKVYFSSNIQYWLSKDKIKFVAVSDQIFKNSSFAHTGNIYPSKLKSTMDTQNKVYEFSEKICKYLQQQKCYGLVGIDIIVTKGGNIYSPEVNARLNASTFVALLIRELFGKDEVCWKSFTYHTNQIRVDDFFKKNPDIIIDKNKKFGIFPIDMGPLNAIGEAQLVSIGKTIGGVNQYINMLK